MGQVWEGNLSGAGLKVALIVARFNSIITERLLAGAQDALRRSGVREEDIDTVRVPGSWEIPGVAREVLSIARHDAVICLGAVIRGDTPHFDYVASEAAKGIGQLSSTASVPVVFGVLTCNTVDQAVDRAGGKGGNKGFDAAMTAIEMANLYRRLRNG